MENKEEFLDILQRQLAGELDGAQIQAHLDYYRNYIGTELQKGRTWEEIAAELGDPRLIAKTLADTNIPSVSAETEGYAGENTRQTTVKKLDLSTWYGKLLVILIAAGVIALVFTVLSALLPVIGIVLLISIAVRLWKNR